MLISPPFLPPRTGQQTEDEWLDLAMNGDAPGRGAFPVSFNLGWHGGIHLTAPKAGHAHEPVRAIADGTIVFVRPPTKGLPNLPPEHPLMYNGATSDGVVVIRHEAEIGEGEQARVVFFSVYMHLHDISPAALLKRFVHRKEIIGQAGYINGEKGRLHVEIICDDANLVRLAGRAADPLSLASDGRNDVIFGETFFLIPAGTPVFDQEPLPHSAQAVTPAPKRKRRAGDEEPDPPVALTAIHATASDYLVGVRYPGAEGDVARTGEAVVTACAMDGSRIGAPLPDKDGEAGLYRNAVRIAKAFPDAQRPAPAAVYELLRFGRVIGPDKLPSASLPHWRKVPYSEGFGWVNLHASNIRIFSDADFPPWKGWRLIDDDTDQDSRCDSGTIRRWLDSNCDGRVQVEEATARLRMTHFLGEAAVECTYLVIMAEGAVSFARKPTHESFQPESAGFYMPKAKTDYLYYLSGMLGNIEEHDGPKFRGRGIKQLSGRENYGKYWVYRGWISPTSFESTWWHPSNPAKAPKVTDPQWLSINVYNAIDSGGWYWTAGAQDNKFKTINLRITSSIIDQATVQAVAAAINGINRSTGKPNHLDERLKETLWAQNILLDDKK